MTNAFPMYDDNGNVVALTTDASIFIGQYEYDPFGQIISMDNLQLINHPFRWSSKFSISYVNIYYYGYRYYNARLGRWLNKDPIEERGGVNLYVALNNRPVYQIDYFGLTSYEGRYQCLCDRKNVNKKIEEMSRIAGLESKKSYENEVPTALKKSPYSGGREFGGRICCNTKTKKVESTGPKGGEFRKANTFWIGVEIELDKMPPCGELGEDWVDAGFYHSHPSGSDRFSDGDVDWSNASGLPLGVGTPDGGTSLMEPVRFDKSVPGGMLHDYPGGLGWDVNADGTLNPKPDSIPDGRRP